MASGTKCRRFEPCYLNKKPYTRVLFILALLGRVVTLDTLGSIDVHSEFLANFKILYYLFFYPSAHLYRIFALVEFKHTLYGGFHLSLNSIKLAVVINPSLISETIFSIILDIRIRKQYVTLSPHQPLSSLEK